MTELRLGEVFYFTVQTTQASTGAAYDAMVSPTFRVYENGTTTPILTGSLAKLDDANTTGFYIGVLTLSPENGFEVGKFYHVRTEGVIDGVMGAKVESFVLRAPGINADDYELLMTYMRNKKVKSGNTFTIYASDDVTPLYTCLVTESDVQTIFGRFVKVGT